jgi:hypothetical protein
MRKTTIWVFLSAIFYINGCATLSNWTKEDYSLLTDKNFFISKISFTVPSSIERSPYVQGLFISNESEETRKFLDSLYNVYYWRILDGIPLREIKRKIENEKGIIVNIEESESIFVQKKEKLVKTDDYYNGRSYSWQSPTYTPKENVIEIEYYVCNLMQCNGGNSVLSLKIMKGTSDQKQRLNRYSANFGTGFALLIANLESREGILDAMNDFVKNVTNLLKE